MGTALKHNICTVLELFWGCVPNRPTTGALGWQLAAYAHVTELDNHPELRTHDASCFGQESLKFKSRHCVRSSKQQSYVLTFYLRQTCCMLAEARAHASRSRKRFWALCQSGRFLFREDEQLQSISRQSGQPPGLWTARCRSWSSCRTRPRVCRQSNIPANIGQATNIGLRSATSNRIGLSDGLGQFETPTC